MTSMAREDSLEGPRKRAKTTTSAFGVSKREGHDSSVYYNSRMYDDLVSQKDVGEAKSLPSELENIVINGDSRNVPIPDNCVHLVVTSPPYNASKAYDEDLSLTEYLGLLHEVFSECYRILTKASTQ